MCVMAVSRVCVNMAATSLSHSSQDKAYAQGRIEYYQGVSDDGCSSGVVRVVQESESIPCVCSL